MSDHQKIRKMSRKEEDQDSNYAEGTNKSIISILDNVMQAAEQEASVIKDQYNSVAKLRDEEYLVGNNVADLECNNNTINNSPLSAM